VCVCVTEILATEKWQFNHHPNKQEQEEE